VLLVVNNLFDPQGLVFHSLLERGLGHRKSKDFT